MIPIPAKFFLMSNRTFSTSYLVACVMLSEIPVCICWLIWGLNEPIIVFKIFLSCSIFTGTSEVITYINLWILAAKQFRVCAEVLSGCCPR